MHSNPFIHRGSPIRHPINFHGRKRLVEQILADLGNGQSVSIVGPRRIGKTSLAFHFSNPDIYTDLISNAGEICFVYIDCSEWATEEPGVLYSLLVENTQDALAANFDISIAANIEKSIPYRDFRSFIRNVMRQQIRLIFILDEFDALAQNKALDADFFSGLRSLHIQYGLVYVTISTEPFSSLIFQNQSALSSPFFNILTRKDVPLFSHSEAQEMLAAIVGRTDVKFSSTMLAYLIELAGTHPLFLQIAGHHAFEVLANNHEDESQKGHKETICKQFLSEVEGHYRYFWSKLSSREQKQLFLLSVASTAEQQILQKLVEQCLIVEQNKHFAYVSAGFRQFLSYQSGRSVINAHPIVIDVEQKLILLYDRELSLTPAEFALIHYLVINARRVTSKAELGKHILDELGALPEYNGDQADEIDDSLVKHASEEGNRSDYEDKFSNTFKPLMKKLGDDKDLIRNVRGEGYTYMGMKPATD